MPIAPSSSRRNNLEPGVFSIYDRRDNHRGDHHSHIGRSRSGVFRGRRNCHNDYVRYTLRNLEVVLD